MENRQRHAAVHRPADADPSSADTLIVGSLEKGFRVLEAFQKGHRNLGVTEIAAITGLDKSAAQRFANTLHRLGYLQKDATTRRYRPAIRLMDMAFTYLSHDRLAEIAIVRLIDAAKRYETTINLAVLDGTDIVYTLRIPHERASYVATIPGRRMPTFCTSSGTVMLAFRDRAEAEAIIDASDRQSITGQTITDRDAVMRRIDEARRQGYGLGVGQALPDEISIAAPVFDSRGLAIAAVQIPVYQPQWTVAAARAKIAPVAMETARAISGSISADEG